jgi:hypothetical protein
MWSYYTVIQIEKWFMPYNLKIYSIFKGVGWICVSQERKYEQKAIRIQSKFLQISILYVQKGCHR